MIIKKLALGIVSLGIAAASSIAANSASDNSSNAPYADGWQTGDNGGSGFAAWTLTAGGPDFAGSYIGATGLPGGNHFGLFSSGNAGNASSADRGFTGGALVAGQTFSINLGFTAITGAGGDVGINLLDGATVVFTLKAVNGGANWLLNDGGSDFGAGAAATGNTAYTFNFTYNGGNSYSYSIGAGSGNNFTATSTLTNITGFRLFSAQQGADQNFGFDNMSVVPEPATVLLVAPALLGGMFFIRRRRA